MAKLRCQSAIHFHNNFEMMEYKEYERCLGGLGWHQGTCKAGILSSPITRV